MATYDPGRPKADEHIPYFGRYIELAPDGDIVTTLTSQIEETTRFLLEFSTEQARVRPAPGEWSVAEIVGHLIDTERILTYRALRIARADAALWESIDFEQYVEQAGFNDRTLPSLVDEFVTTRRATVAFLSGLGEAAWLRRMPEEWSCRSVRSLAWVIAGHEIYHVRDVQARW